MIDFIGSINCYRIFDIGGEVDLARALETLNRKGLSELFKLRRSSRSLVIDEVPLVLSLGAWTQEIKGSNYDVIAYGKLWGFGAVSINLKIDIKSAISFSTAKEIAQYCDEDEDFHNLALERVRNITDEIKSALHNPIIWDQYEDYIIFNLSHKQVNAELIKKMIAGQELYELILMESKYRLSDQMISPIKQNIFHYSDDDVVVIDWNSAFICSEGDSLDISDVIEFSLTQLLELRYYDNLLDKKLNTLYKSVMGQRPNMFSRKYNDIAKEASSLYIETSEIVEKIENSLKLVGDFYYAKIYRATVDRLRVKDWQQSVDQKLSNILNVSTLFENDQNNRTNHTLELIIIALITVELIPLIKGIIEKMF